MEIIERIVKVILELAILVIFLLFIKLIYGSVNSIVLVISCLCVHLICWFLSGQFFVTITYFGYRVSKEKVDEYLFRLKQICKNEKSISKLLLVGSISRGAFSDLSDIDICVIPEQGFLNLIRAALFIHYLRAHSFFSAKPLDIYLFEEKNIQRKISKNAVPINLLAKE